MNAGSIVRILLIATSGVLIFMWLQGPDKSEQVDPFRDPTRLTPPQRAAYQYCEINTDLFRAQLTSRGATLKRFELKREKYQRNEHPLDLSTTPQPGAVPGTPQEHDPSIRGDHEFRQQLFVQFRNRTVSGSEEGTNWNLEYDSVDWQLAGTTGQNCVFTYSDESVELKKEIAATERPYELTVKTTIKNVSDETKFHAAAVDTVAFRLESEVKAAMFRVSPYVTNVECVMTDGSAVRKLPADFEPDDLTEPEFKQADPYGWFTAPGAAAVASVSNAYFTHALVPTDEKKPFCQLQIWPIRTAGGEPAAFYRARLAYPLKSLEPGAEATYDVLTFVGPKERDVLAQAAGGTHNLLELIDLGFFSSIAKILVSFLLSVHSVVPNWGIAIIVLTICARVLLFPLAVPGIRTMLKMRDLRPELDKLSEKYKDDMQAKGQAQMKLMTQHGIGPMDQLKGCLPQIATMPVWFALYTTLQTAVELYNIPFLWFPDLSEPDPYFILPFVIGATYYVQQKIMPMTGDPAQRKMMMYFMPGMFTVFMLFLPAGLGVYMFTNSLLAILQQQGVELHAKRKTAHGSVVVSEKETPQAQSTPKTRRKGRA